MKRNIVFALLACFKHLMKMKSRRHFKTGTEIFGWLKSKCFFCYHQPLCGIIQRVCLQRKLLLGLVIILVASAKYVESFSTQIGERAVVTTLPDFF